MPTNYRIKKLRIKKGLKAKQVAFILRMRENRYNQIVCGHDKNVNGEYKERIAQYFGKTANWLFSEKAYERKSVIEN